MPGMTRKPGKGDGSYVKGRPIKAAPQAAKVNPKSMKALKGAKKNNRKTY